MAQQLAVAKELGVGEVGIYNYGLLHRSEVQEFTVVLRSAFS